MFQRNGLFCPLTTILAPLLPRVTPVLSSSMARDGLVPFGGLLTGSSGSMDSTDVMYVTPISFVLKTIRNHKSLAKAYPKSGPSA